MIVLSHKPETEILDQGIEGSNPSSPATLGDIFLG